MSLTARNTLCIATREGDILVGWTSNEMNYMKENKILEGFLTRSDCIWQNKWMMKET